MMTRGFAIGPVGTHKPMASMGSQGQFFPQRRYATTLPAMSASYKGAGHGTIKPMVTADAKRIPRKPGQKAKSDKHSDLYTCLLYTSPSPRDRSVPRMPSSA